MDVPWDSFLEVCMKNGVFGLWLLYMGYLVMDPRFLQRRIGLSSHCM